jgi:hypothetical protein
MPTVQRPMTVESIHQPETLNEFKENPGREMEILMQYFCGLANGTCVEIFKQLVYGLANGTYTENLELHNQSLHQLANGTCTENLELHNQSLHQLANGTCTENLELHNQSLHQLANGTCTENLELHNQSFHQLADGNSDNVIVCRLYWSYHGCLNVSRVFQDVDALLSSINVNALLNSTEDTEDGIGQRKPTWNMYFYNLLCKS